MDQTHGLGLVLTMDKFQPILSFDKRIIYLNQISTNNTNLKKLIDIGIALSKEKNINILLEKILNEARIISNSDGGTVYLVIDDGTRLNFEILMM